MGLEVGQPNAFAAASTASTARRCASSIVATGSPMMMSPGRRRRLRLPAGMCRRACQDDSRGD